MITQIPLYVKSILNALNKAGFEAYIVGGCVRDLLMKRSPVDWDVTTNATPEQIQSIFPESFYENVFGTVGIKCNENSFLNKDEEWLSDKKIIVEVTTYRTESNYSNNRHPDAVLFSKTLTEDLKRRDFTMNAIALKIINNTSDCEIIDPYNGQDDIKNKLITAVGIPDERFNEDALRMMRAVRFSAQLEFNIENSTYNSIQKHSATLVKIAKERIRDELSKIILSERPSEGIDLLQKLNLLKHIIPELEEGIDVGQNLHHIYTVYEHNIKALKTCPSKKLSVRLAALLHDVAKPRTKRGNGKYATFYNHDHVGARMTRIILTRLHFSKKIIEKATLLVDQHLFYYNVDEVTEAAVRRIIKRVGLENMKDLIDVRIGDRLGSGVPKAKPYRLRHFEYMIDKVSQDPISVKMLKINGKDLITELKIKPGPKIGAILDVLLSDVLDDPQRNTRNYLLPRTQELNKQDLIALRKLAKSKIAKENEKTNTSIKEKHWIK